MGLVWTGQSVTDQRDGKTYIIHQRRHYRGTLTATQETAPGNESKLPTQTYFSSYDGRVLFPGCNCTWDERRSGHVCDRREWYIMNRRAQRTNNCRLR